MWVAAWEAEYAFDSGPPNAADSKESSTHHNATDLCGGQSTLTGP